MGRKSYNKKKRAKGIVKTSKEEDFLKRLFSSKWLVIALFASLTLLYFATFLSSDVAIMGTDHDPRVFFHKNSVEDLSRYVHPQNWSRNLGGMAISDRRVGDAFFPLIFLRYLLPFYKSLGWWYIIITFCAGFFMFLYIESLRIRRTVAILIGICYMFAPTILSLTYGGHYAKMEVIALTPLLFLSIEKGMETRKFKYVLLLSAVVALEIYTNHLQYAYFSFWGAGLYFLFKLWQTFKAERNLRNLFERVILFAVGFSWGIAIGAMNLFPAYVHTTTVSKRAGGTSLQYASSWALHPEEVGSLVVPEFGNHLKYYWGRNYFKLNSEYMGIIVLLFAFSALFIVKRDPRLWFFLFLFIFALLYALGPHTPVHKLFYLYFPGVKSLRGPSMISFLFLLATCVMAGLGLEKILSLQKESEILYTTKLLLIISIIGVCIAMILAASVRPFFSLWVHTIYQNISPQKKQIMIANFPNVQKGLYLFSFFLISTTVLIYLKLKNKLSELSFIALLIPLILVDTWRVDKQFLNYVDPHLFQGEIAAENRLANFLKQDNSDYRVLALTGNGRFRLKGVNMVSYFDDFTNKRYYQITQPQNLNSLNIINLLNTKYIVSKKRLRIPGMEEIYTQNGFFVYKNSQALPYFFLVDHFVVEKDPQKVIQMLKSPSFDCKRVVILEEEPEVKFSAPSTGEKRDVVEKLKYNEKAGYIKLKVYCSGQRFLVVCENYHPNWRAFVDGKEGKIYRADYVWKGVFLEPGEHIIEFKYHSKIASVCRWGSFISFLGFLATILLMKTDMSFTRKPNS